MILPRSAEHAAIATGKLTGSAFNVVMNGGPRAWATLMKKLGQPRQFSDESRVPALAWGVRHEPALRAEYELRHWCEVEQPAFVQHESLYFVGFSPDGLVQPDGVIEGKCPYNEMIHARTVAEREVPREYYWQCVGGMWVCKREWCDFISFDPRERDPEKRLVVIRLLRDENEIQRLHDGCVEFWDAYSAGIEPEPVKVTKTMLDQLTF